MGWDELRTRARQAATKRIALAKYRLGLPPIEKEQGHAGSGHFFFAAGELSGITDLLRYHLTGEVQNTLTEADAICGHRFRILGYDEIDFGNEIDWHLDTVHGIRVSREPWHKIPYLDFVTVGDHKVIWELNRHQHLVTLARAWVLTRERRYATELMQQWYSWQKANPYPIGINWCSSLEVAFRSLSWLWMRFLLADCPHVPPLFFNDVAGALVVHGTHIEQNLSTYFSPNTHLLGEALALFFIGTLCPQIPNADRWRQGGWRILLEQAQRQTRSDGMYFEHSVYYHVYALDLLLHARVLAERNNVDVPSEFDQVLAKMLDVLQALSQTAPPPLIGDDDGGRVFNPRRNTCSNLSDPLALSAIVPGREYLACLAPITEEAIWLLGQQSRNQETVSAEPAHAVALEASGIYIMASSVPYAQQMVINAGPGPASHRHADALSITLAVDEKQWLIDPGTFSYMDKQERDYFRGTRAHNTITVDGKDQADANGPFSWVSHPTPSVQYWDSGSDFSLFVGSHDGYRRLPDPVLHGRVVFHLHGKLWLIRDLIEGQREHRIEANWHFAGDVDIQRVGNSFLARRTEDTKSGLWLGLLRDPTLSAEIIRGEMSRAYGHKQSSPLLRVSGRSALPLETAVLIQPLLHSGPLGAFTRVGAAPSSNKPSYYQYEESETIHHFILRNADGRWRVGPWASDALFLYGRTEAGHVKNLILADGSFARWRETPVIASGQRNKHIVWP